MARTKKTKVVIKREKTSLGWAYRIYIDGTYMGAALTPTSAREGAKRMLAIYQRTGPCRAEKSLVNIPRMRYNPTEQWGIPTVRCVYQPGIRWGNQMKKIALILGALLAAGSVAKAQYGSGGYNSGVTNPSTHTVRPYITQQAQGGAAAHSDQSKHNANG